MNLPVVIHLVHGTWPYGIFGFGRQSWFDEGSSFRASIGVGLGDNVTFRVCRWSGKNSVAERKKASLILHSQIITAIEDTPNARHIVIAHSHGGTVAADALSYVFQPTQLTRISAFIALATPFAYTRAVSSTTAELNGFALATLITTFFFLLINSLIVELPTGFLLFAGWLLCNFTMIFFVWIYCKSSVINAYMGEPIDPTVPVFLLRATRDEAALSLAVAEAFNGINFFIAQHLSARRGLVAAIALIAVYAAMSRYVLEGNPLPVPDKSGSDIGIYLIAYQTIPCAFAMLGQVVLAIATGMPIRLWRDFRVEIDAAPPYTICAFRSYSDFYGHTRPPMRHGLYDLTFVQEDVRDLVTCAIKGHVLALKPFR